MNSDFTPDLMTLIDDEGKEHLFEILDSLENENGTFYALFPKSNKDVDDSEIESNYYIFEAIDDNGEQVLSEVEDPELLNSLAQTFESHFEELYEINDEN